MSWYMFPLSPVLAYCAPRCPPVRLIVKSLDVQGPRGSLSGLEYLLSVDAVLVSKRGLHFFLFFAKQITWSWLSDSHCALAWGEAFFSHMMFATKFSLPNISSIIILA